MDSAIVSLLAVIAAIVAFDLAAAAWGVDTRLPSDPRRDWEGPTFSIR